MVHDLVCEFQMTCLRGTCVMEWKQNVGYMNGQTDMGKI